MCPVGFRKDEKGGFAPIVLPKEFPGFKKQSRSPSFWLFYAFKTGGRANQIIPAEIKLNDEKKINENW